MFEKVPQALENSIYNSRFSIESDPFSIRNDIPQKIRVNLLLNGTIDPNYVALNIDLEDKHSPDFFGFVEIRIICRNSSDEDCHNNCVIDSSISFSQGNYRCAIHNLVPRSELLNERSILLIENSMIMTIRFRKSDQPFEPFSM